MIIDTYATFEDLIGYRAEGKDFRIVVQKTSSPFLIMAIHGGNIEPFTSEIATSIAGEDYGLYLFEGIREQGNKEMHITSEYFDEPRAKDMVRSADVVIAIHGHHDQENEFVMVGGRCEGLAEKIAMHLQDINIEMRAIDVRFSPNDPRNICNQGMSKGGVEIEISRRLRDVLRDDEGMYKLFTNAIRHAIVAYR